MEYKVIITIVVFLLAYLAISLDLINRATAALLGASIILMFRVIPIETALAKIDMNIVILLISMMITVSIIRETGFFQYVAIRAAKLAKGEPLRLIVLLMIITAVFSAFLDNVTTILVLSPLSVLIAVELGLSPLPFLITQAIASNIGGTSTLIGDPPNIMIGYNTGLTFNDFLINLGPLIILIMLVAIGITFLLFRNKLTVHNERRARIMEFDESEAITNRPFLYKSLLIFSLVIAGFLLHSVLDIGLSAIALFGATLLIILSGDKPESHFLEIEWVTIFFFIGLFVMVGALEEVGVIDFLGKKLADLSGNNILLASFSIIWGSGLLSGFIDNIPFVATMIPLIEIMNSHFGPDAGNVLWWSLSTGACLGGNFTLIGAAANVIAAGIAARNGYPISFKEFTKVSFIYTIVSLLITSAYIYLRYLI
jgi:Na+/H+ antiporter NhaD/arsenite permease-like protein